MITILSADLFKGVDPTIVTALIAGAVAIFTNAGLWGILQKMQQHKYDKETEKSDEVAKTLAKLEESQEQMSSTLKLQGQVLKGIGHDRIIYLGKIFCEQGYVTTDEYENLNEYLYKPYIDLGGNGTAKKMMSQVDKLPIRDGKDVRDDMEQERNSD